MWKMLVRQKPITPPTVLVIDHDGMFNVHEPKLFWANQQVSCFAISIRIMRQVAYTSALGSI